MVFLFMAKLVKATIKWQFSEKKIILRKMGHVADCL